MDNENAEHGELVGQILDVIAKEGMVDRARITLDATLEDLGLKSMDVVIILSGIEEKFSVYIPIDGPLAEAKDVREFVGHVVEQIVRKEA